MTTRAISYDRVSTVGQGATDLRTHALRAFAAEHGLDLIEECVDKAVSGGVPLAERPGGALALSAARSAKATVLIAPTLDRLFRDTLDGLRCMREEFPALGLRVILTDESLDLSTAEGQFFAIQRLAFAEYERHKAGERTLRNTRALQKAGRAYGHTPYGCIRHGDALYREPNTWAQRERIVSQCATHSLRDVSADVRRAQIPAPNGGEVWSTSTIREIVKTHNRLALLPLAPGASAANGATHSTPTREAVASFEAGHA